MSNGNHPIDFEEPNIAMGDAARLARIEEKSIRNWIARDLLDVGTKIGPRWTFTVLDMVVLKVASHLVACTRMEPKVATRIAQVTAHQVKTRALQMTERNPKTGQLVELENGYQHWQSILVAIEGDNIRLATAGSDPSRRDPPRYTDASAAFLRRPHVVIPIDALVNDLIFDIERLSTGDQLDGESE